jgi:hypothetical protein
MLAQADAQMLIKLEKYFEDLSPISIPPGIDESRILTSQFPHERFLMDIWRGTLRISKVKLQTRARKVIVLVRLDVGGAPHTNPDGSRLTGPHVHLYREGYDDKWAYPIDSGSFSNLANNAQLFYDFCRYCNIVRAREFQQVLI